MWESDVIVLTGVCVCVAGCQREAVWESDVIVLTGVCVCQDARERQCGRVM